MNYAFREARIVFVEKKENNREAIKTEKEQEWKSAEQKAKSILEKDFSSLSSSEKEELEIFTDEEVRHFSHHHQRKLREYRRTEKNPDEIKDFVSEIEKLHKEEEWKRLLAFPFSEVRETLRNKDLLTFFQILARKSGEDEAVREYILSEIDVGVINELSEKGVKEARKLRESAKQKVSVTEKLRNASYESYYAAANAEVDEIQETRSRHERDVTLGASALVESNMSTKNDFLEEGRNIEHLGSDEELLENIKTTFGAESAAYISAKKASESQQSEHEKEEEKTTEKKQELREEILAKVQNAIAEEMSEAAREGARELRLFLDRIEPQMESFLEESLEGVHHPDDAKEIHKKMDTARRGQLHILFRKARSFCEKSEASENDRDLLEQLTVGDISLEALPLKKDASEKEIADQEKSLSSVNATKSAIEKIENKKQEISEEANLIRQKYAPQLQKLRKKFFGKPDEESAKILNEDGVAISKNHELLEEELRAAIADGRIPHLAQTDAGKKFQEKYGLDELTSQSILEGVLPLECSLHLSESFLQKILEKEERKKVETIPLFQYYKKNGTLRTALLENAQEDAHLIIDHTLAGFLDVEKGEATSAEEMKNAGESAAKNLIPLMEVAKERASDLQRDLENLRSLEEKFPDQTGIRETKKIYEGILKLANVRGSLGKISDNERRYIYETLQKIATTSEGITPEELRHTLLNLTEKTRTNMVLLQNASPEKVNRLFEGNTSTNQIAFDPHSDFEKQKKSTEERENLIRDRLQKFSEWVSSGKNPQDIFELAKELQNFDGSPVLKIVDDNTFDKKHGGGKKAEISFFLKGFQIQVRKSSWEEKDPDLALSLRHEGWHAIDKASNFSLSKDFQKFLKEKGVFENTMQNFLSRYPETPKKDQLKELLAYALSGEFPVTGMEEFLESNAVSDASKYFSENGAKRGFFGRRDRLYRSQYNPQNNANYEIEFAVQEKRLKADIDSLKKVPKSGDLVSDLEMKLGNLREQMANGITDDSWKEVLEAKDIGITQLVSAAEDALKEAAENTEMKEGYFEKLWDNTQFLSMMDLGNMWETIVEQTKRKHARNSKLRAGKAGKAIFDKVYPDLANEFDNDAEAAEIEEVENYEKGLINKDGWQIMERLDETNKKDELKACLNILAKNGQIDWYDRRIWRALEKGGGSITILETDANDMNSLKIKLRRMCGLLWDDDYFSTLDRDNSSSYQSRKEGYKEELAANVQNIGGMIESFFKQKKAGKEVDPQRFEAYLEGCIREGKSTPEEVFWYIFQSVDLGILNMDRISYFDNEFTNQYPPIQWFYDKKPKLAEVQDIAKMFPAKNGKMPDAFKDWMVATVFANTNVQQRIIKEAKGEGWDHDWATTIFSTGTATSATEILNKNDNGSNMAATAYPNMTIGHLNYITNLARNTELYPDKKLEEEVVRHLGFTGMYNMIALGKVRDRKLHRIDEFDLKKPPRSTAATLYGGPADMSTRELLESGNEILVAADPHNFSFLNGSRDITKEYEQIFNELQKDYSDVFERKPSDAIDLMKMMPKAFEKAIHNNPANLTNVLNTAKSVYARDHNGHLDDTRLKEAEAAAQNRVSPSEKTENIGMYNR